MIIHIRNKKGIIVGDFNIDVLANLDFHKFYQNMLNWLDFQHT